MSRDYCESLSTVSEQARHRNGVFFDLDNTIAHYDPFFVRSVGRSSALQVARVTLGAADFNTFNNLVAQTPESTQARQLLVETAGTESLPLYYEACQALLNSKLDRSHVTFDAPAIRLLALLERLKIPTGIISNNSPLTGRRVIRFLFEDSGIDLQDRSVFLAQEDYKKPDPHAWDAFVLKCKAYTFREPRGFYIGDTLGDMNFSRAIGMIGVHILPSQINCGGHIDLGNLDILTAAIQEAEKC